MVEFLVLLVLVVLGLALVGFVVVVRWLFRSRNLHTTFDDEPAALPAPALISRRDRLRVTRSVLRDRMPADLLAELARLEGRKPLFEAPKPPPRPAPVATPVPEPEPEQASLGEALGSDLPLDIDDRPLRPDPEVAAAARAASAQSERVAWRSFLSFEHIIFALSALLILGGSLYFAALTWDRIPGYWQRPFLAAVVLAYGALFLGAARLLRVRLGLETAARPLAGVSFGVCVVGVLIAAAASQDLAPIAVVEMVLAGLLAGPALSRATGEDPSWKPGAVGLAVTALGLAGYLAFFLGDAGGGAVLLIGAAALLRFPRAPEAGFLWRVVASVAITVAGLLLVPPAFLEAAAVAPALGLAAAHGRALRRGDVAWGEIAAVVLAGLALLISLSHVGAVAATLAAVTFALLWTSEPQDEQPGKAATLAAAFSFLLLCFAWAPGVGQLFPAEWKAAIWKIVLGESNRPAASWDGLAAIPGALLAFYAVSRRFTPGGFRGRVAEVLGFVVLGFVGLSALLSLHLQTVPGVVTLVLATGVAVWRARQQGGLARELGAVALALATAFAVGYAVSPETAFIAAATAAIALGFWRSPAGRVPALLVVPIMLLIALMIGEHSALLLASIAALFGALMLAQPPPRVLEWQRPFGAPALVVAVMIACCYAPVMTRALLHEEYLGAVVALSLVPFAAWLLRHRQPAWLRWELIVAGVGAGLVCFFVAAVEGPGSAAAQLQSGAMLLAGAIAASAAITHSRRGRDIALELALVWLAAAAITANDEVLRWPAALCLGVAAAAYAPLSRRIQSRVVAWSGWVGLGLALVWGLFVVAKIFSTGGGEERILPPLAILLSVYGIAVWHLCLRHSAFETEQRFAFVCGVLVLAALALAAGAERVQHPRGLDLALGALAFVAVFALSVNVAFKGREARALYLAQACFVGLYAWLRERSGLLGGLDGYDGLAVVIGAFVFLGVSRWLEDRKLELGPLETRRFATLLPMLLPFVLEWKGDLLDSGVLIAAAGLYGWMARQRRDSRFAWASALAADIALALLLSRFGASGPMSLMLPVGFSLIVLARIYRQQYANIAPVMHTIGVFCVLTPAGLEALRFEAAWPALLLAALSVAGVLLGIRWRLRSFLYAGFAFLAMDIVANLTRWGMNDRLIAGVLGVVAGVILFSFGIVIARNKEALLARYAVVQSWEW